MKRFFWILFIVLSALCGSCEATQPQAWFPRPMVNSTDLIDNDHPLPIAGTVTTTIGALPTSTSVIGSVRIDQTTPGTTNAIQPSSASVGSATAGIVPSKPFGAQIYLTDGSSLQQWLTSIILGDGVNGNNTAAVAQWFWNGSTYDRVRGNASDGMTVRAIKTEQAVASVSSVLCPGVMASTSVYLLTTGADTEITALTGRTFFELNSTGTFLLSIGSTPVNTSIAPCYNYGRNWGDSISLYVKALATNTYLTVYQGK